MNGLAGRPPSGDSPSRDFPGGDSEGRDAQSRDAQGSDDRSDDSGSPDGECVALHASADTAQDERLAGVSSSAIRQELARRARALPRLLEQRAQLRAQLQALDEEIMLLGRIAEQASRPPIADAVAGIVPLEHVISAMTAADLLRETRGYRETRTSLAETVMLALSSDARFRKVGVGQYKRVA